MNRTFILALTAFVVAGFTMPAAVAGWNSHGQTEPSTEWDTDAALMQQGIVAGEVYFNAFAQNTHTVINGPAGMNPNTAALGSSVYPTPLLYWQAVFGVWTDCNGDGFIGQAESAVMEYSSVALLDDSVCPVDSAHNDGQWVWELIHIGRVDQCTKEDAEVRQDANHPCFGAAEHFDRPNVIYTENTKMWGDPGFPGQVLVGTSCPIRPHPSGTFSNTGAMIGAADCIIGYRVGRDVLGFENPTQPQDEDHPLVINLPVSPFGNPYEDERRTGLFEQNTEEPTASVWDCSGDEPAPGVPTVASDPTSASVYDTASGVVDGIYALNVVGPTVVDAWNAEAAPTVQSVEGSNWELTWNDSDCDGSTKNSVDGIYYEELNLYGQDKSGVGLIEGSNQATPDGRIENEIFYTFDNSGYESEAIGPALAPITGAKTPPNGGLAAVSGTYNVIWSNSVIYVSTPQSINRATLAPAAAAYWSHYVQIDPAEFSTLGLGTPGGTAVYGAANCPTIGEGAPDANGWVCDPTKWYVGSGGSTRTPYRDGSFPEALPGESYHFRDVDCYDGTVVGGTFVRASVVDASANGPCVDSEPSPLRPVLVPEE